MLFLQHFLSFDFRLPKTMFKLVVVTCPAATEGATLATTKGWTDVKACVHATTRTRRRRRRVTTEDFISLAVAGFKGKDSRVDFQAGKLIVTQKIEIVVNDAAMVDSRSTVSRNDDVSDPFVRRFDFFISVPDRFHFRNGVVPSSTLVLLSVVQNAAYGLWYILLVTKGVLYW
jgi:hypothetical protein